jgi:predicted component of type VI protein secretion system
MPASSPVERIIESINDSFGNFNPESVVPEVEGLLEHLPEIFEAFRSNLTKLTGKMEEDLPLNGAVPDAMRELDVPLAGLEDAAREVNTTFRRVHEADLKRHYEPRKVERKWNVDA